uniref:Uncharacterized protein n=1 Tax=Alexandrium catenella TaxID=2925 RepID=A0A7S1W0B7_ALECA
MELRRKKVPYRMLWVETVGKAFLEPFGLYDLEAFMAADAAAVERIVAANPQYQGSRFQVPRPGRFGSLVMSGTLLSPDGFRASKDNAISLQMSPDFTGAPFYPDNNSVAYAPTQVAGGPLEKVLIGGGMVESFAWGGPAPPQRKAQAGGEAVPLVAPASPLSLAKAVGISSAAFAGEATQLLNMGENLNPQAYVWPVTSAWHPRPQKALPYQLGDGGNLENTGVLAALQRGATRIVAMINSDIPLDPSANLCAPAPALSLPGRVTSQLANLFGFLEGSSGATYNTRNQVFDSSEFMPLLCEFQGLKSQGRPLVLRKQLVVQANTWWGIAGGTSVDVAFSLLDSAFAFQDQLPQETQAALSQGPIGGLSGFPNFKTTFNNFPDLTRYTPRQINLLAALTEWSVTQNAELFRGLLAA